MCTRFAIAVSLLLYSATAHDQEAGGIPKPRGESFQIASKPVHLRYGEVFQDLQEPVLIPEDVRELFRSNRMAITGYHADIVEMNEAGDIVQSVPLFDCYLHHYGAMLGKYEELKYFYDKRARKQLSSVDNSTSYEDASLPHMKNFETMFRADVTEKFGYQAKPHTVAAVGGGSGAEERNTPHVYPAPYGLVVDGVDAFMPLMHLINSRHSSEENGYSKLLECPCTSERNFNYQAQTIDGKPPAIPFYCNAELMLEGNTACSLETYQNGFRCCDNGVFLAEKDERERHPDATGYFGMQFTFYFIKADDSTIRLRDTESCCDVTGDLNHHGNIEYDVKQCVDGEECIHKAVTRQYLDVPGLAGGFGSSQKTPMTPAEKAAIDAGAEVDIVYAVGHQHVGAATPIGISLYKDSTNELLCHSVPRYGQGKEAGNERGYVVGITPCVFGGQQGQRAPPRLRRDSVVRVEAFYNTTHAHDGLMALWLMKLADVPAGPAASKATALTEPSRRVW